MARSLPKPVLRAGVAIGIAMVVVPFFLAAVGIVMASGVPGGLRGATHLPEKAEEVSFAFSTTTALALLAPPGILLAVGCGLALVSDRRKPAR